MRIVKCGMDDTDELAVMNKRLIDDEKSSNPMSIDELRDRMAGFLAGEYEAFFFVDGDVVIGYALVKISVSPLYLRQFFVKEECRRKHYGTTAFRALLQHLGVESIELEVLPWNEPGMRFWSSLGFKEISRYMRLEATSAKGSFN